MNFDARNAGVNYHLAVLHVTDKPITIAPGTEASYGVITIRHQDMNIDVDDPSQVINWTFLNKLKTMSGINRNRVIRPRYRGIQFDIDNPKFKNLLIKIFKRYYPTHRCTSQGVWLIYDN